MGFIPHSSSFFESVSVTRMGLRFKAREELLPRQHSLVQIQECLMKLQQQPVCDLLQHNLVVFVIY